MARSAHLGPKERERPLTVAVPAARVFAVLADPMTARLRTHGAELVGELEQYEHSYQLCCIRGPEGVVVGLAVRLG